MRADTLYGLLFALLMGGLAAAGYAAYETVNSAAAAVCSTSGFVSCAAVGSSGHTTILGIEDWQVGIGGYVVMVAVAALAYRTYDRRYLQLLTGLSAVGLLISLYFVYEELAVIQHLCPVCTTAHLLNVGVLLTSLSLLRLSRPDEDDAGTGKRAAGAGAASDPD